jgi:sec-independent protein translocase protein TatB
MFDFSWGEVLMIGAIALIVIGPKDLPATLRTVGRMIGKIKRMASEFQGQFNEALREADLDKVRKDVEGMNKAASAGFNPVKSIRDEVKGAIDKPGAVKSAAAATAAVSASASNAAAFSGTKFGLAKSEGSAAAAVDSKDDAPATQAPAEPPAKAVTTTDPKPQEAPAETLQAKPKGDAAPRPAKKPVAKPVTKPTAKSAAKPTAKPAAQSVTEAPAKKSASGSRKKEEKQT